MKKSKPKISFLQNHYNQYRLIGGDHALYAVVNDLSNETAEKLKINFETAYPKPISERKKADFKKKLKEEANAAKLKDDAHWLTGTGPYSQ